MAERRVYRTGVQSAAIGALRGRPAFENSVMVSDVNPAQVHTRTWLGWWLKLRRRSWGTAGQTDAGILQGWMRRHCGWVRSRHFRFGAETVRALGERNLPLVSKPLEYCYILVSDPVPVIGFGYPLSGIDFLLADQFRLFIEPF